MIERFIDIIPFLATSCDGNGRPKLNTARILEIALTAAALLYGMNLAVAKLEVKMDSIEKHVVILDDRLFTHMADVEKARRK